MINRGSPSRSPTPDRDSPQTTTVAPRPELPAQEGPTGRASTSSTSGPRRPLTFVFENLEELNAPPPKRQRRNDPPAIRLNTNPLGFSTSQLEQIRQQQGGAATLRCIETRHAELRQAMSIEQILQVSMRRGGADALNRIADHAAQPQPLLPFSVDEFVTVTSSPGGSRALAAMLDEAGALISLGLAADQIMSLATSDGGYKSMQSVAKHGTKLIAQRTQGGLGLTLDDVIEMAKQAGAAPGIDYLAVHCDRFLSLGVPNEAVLTRFLHSNKARNLETLLYEYEHGTTAGSASQPAAPRPSQRARESYGRVQVIVPTAPAPPLPSSESGLLSPEQEQVILSQREGRETLDFILDNSAALSAVMTPDQIAQVAGVDLGHRRLDTLLTLHTQLQQPFPDGIGLSMSDMVRLATGRSGASALPELARSGTELMGAGFSAQQLVAMSSGINAMRALKLARHAPSLTAPRPQGPGYTIDQLATMLSTRQGIAALEALAPQPADVGSGSSSDTSSETSSDTDDEVVVKPDPELVPLQGSNVTLVEQEGDQSRAIFVPQFEYCDMTTGVEKWSVRLDHDNAVVLRQAMDPIPENDHKFLFRDPQQPLARAHARYAADDGSCHPGVRVVSVAQPRGGGAYLKSLFAEDPRLPRKSPSQVDKLIGKLKLEVEAELARLIRETPAPLPCSARKMTAADVKAHEQMLIDRYGLFVDTRVPPEQRPLLSNGRILGLYMGALVETDDEFARLEAERPDHDDYSMDVSRRDSDGKRRPVVLAAEGGTNSIAFANTALLPDSTEPQYDTARLNTIFVPFDVELVDKEGQTRTESVVAAVALDNLYAEDNPSGQVLVNYGDGYLPRFKKLAEMAAATSGEAPEVVVKVEPT